MADPILFALMYESIARVGYWQYESSEENDVIAWRNKGGLAWLFGFNAEVQTGLIRLF